MGAPEEAATALLYILELNWYHRFWKTSSSCTAFFFNHLVTLNRKIPPAITCLSKANLVCPMAQNSCLDSSVIDPYKTCAVWKRGNLMKALAAWTIMVFSSSIIWPYWLRPLRYSWADSFVSGRRSTLALWENAGSTWERRLVHRVPLINPKQSPSNWLKSQPALPSLHFLCSFESEWKIRTSSGVVMTLLQFVSAAKWFLWFKTSYISGIDADQIRYTGPYFCHSWLRCFPIRNFSMICPSGHCHRGPERGFPSSCLTGWMKFKMT